MLTLGASAQALEDPLAIAGPADHIDEEVLPKSVTCSGPCGARSRRPLQPGGGCRRGRRRGQLGPRRRSYVPRTTHECDAALLVRRYLAGLTRQVTRCDDIRERTALGGLSRPRQANVPSTSRRPMSHSAPGDVIDTSG